MVRDKAHLPHKYSIFNTNIQSIVVFYRTPKIFRAGFLTLGITDILDQIILCCKKLSCRIFSSVPGFHPLVSRSTPLKILPSVLWEAKFSLVRATPLGL